MDPLLLAGALDGGGGFPGGPGPISSSASARADSGGSFDNSGFTVNFAPQGAVAWAPIAIGALAFVAVLAVIVSRQ